MVVPGKAISEIDRDRLRRLRRERRGWHRASGRWLIGTWLMRAAIAGLVLIAIAQFAGLLGELPPLVREYR